MKKYINMLMCSIILSDTVARGIVKYIQLNGIKKHIVYFLGSMMVLDILAMIFFNNKE